MSTPAAAVALTGSDQTAFTGQGVYRGITLRETAGAAAYVRVYDGTTNAGTIIGVYSLAANGSCDIECAVQFTIGVRIDIVSGTVEGSVRIG